MALAVRSSLSQLPRQAAATARPSSFRVSLTNSSIIGISSPARAASPPLQAFHRAISSSAVGPRHFLSIQDLTQAEFNTLVQRAADAKKEIKLNKRLQPELENALKGQTVSMMFSKRSTRTRISTEGAVVYMGGHPMFLGKDDIQLGVNESFLDTSRVISSMTSCMVARVGPHKDILELAKHSSVPVINALCNSYHPLQAIADLLTIKEAFPDYLSKGEPLKVAWVGDANNILNDLVVACGKSGITVQAATPKQYPVDPDVLETARQACDEFGNGATVFTTHVPDEAVKDADIIVTDTWISMGQESEKKLRLEQFNGYQVSSELAKKGGAKSGWKFMHCLPRKPEEVTDEVFYDEKRSLVWTEAENRLYAAIAALECFVVRGGKF